MHQKATYQDLRREQEWEQRIDKKNEVVPDKAGGLVRPDGPGNGEGHERIKDGDRKEGGEKPDGKTCGDAVGRSILPNQLIP